MVLATVKNSNFTSRSSRFTISIPGVSRLLLAVSSAITLLAVSGDRSLAAEEVLTPHRVAELRFVTAAAISRDGSRVAYTLSVPRKPGVDDDGEPWVELWVTDAARARPGLSLRAK